MLTCHEVNSRHLKSILKETISGYPGLSFESSKLMIDAPYHALYHYKDELANAMSTLVDEEALSHLSLLVDFIHETFKETISETKHLIAQGLISYEYLWTILRPGVIIYTSMMGQDRAVKLCSYRTSHQPPGLKLDCEFIDFDGTTFGTRDVMRFVPSYKVAVPICTLPAYPITFHYDVPGLEQRLVERGRIWEAHAGMHFCHFTGVAYERNYHGVNRYNIDSRVVVDTKTYHRMNDRYSFEVEPLPAARAALGGSYKDSVDSRAVDLDEGTEGKRRGPVLIALTDSQCMLASASVLGFSFVEKRWLEFVVPGLSPIDWNPDCFDQLVLPSAQKDLVQALVSQHLGKQQQTLQGRSPVAGEQAQVAMDEAVAFDDIIKGKGRGLIMVLHGPPGVGKTLTAETVAEYARRPLYMVSAGELGTSASSLESSLERVLDLAVTWRCVLLLDEADVFLARRDPCGDIGRNALVSIFLRVLEYYPGMLFMTSNRITAFDDAFQSRIHVPLRYRPLDTAARCEVWQNFLGRSQSSTAAKPAAIPAAGSNGSTAQEPEQVTASSSANLLDDAEGLARLAAAPLNGRQIKNVVRTARSLAAFRGVRLDVPLLEQVVRIQLEFEESLAAGDDETK